MNDIIRRAFRKGDRVRCIHGSHDNEIEQDRIYYAIEDEEYGVVEIGDYPDAISTHGKWFDYRFELVETCKTEEEKAKELLESKGWALTPPEKPISIPFTSRELNVIQDALWTVYYSKDNGSLEQLDIFNKIGEYNK